MKSAIIKGGMFSVILFFCLHSFSQEYRIKKYEDTGMPSIIRYSYQDSKGFLWLGTQNGLYKYNGKYFKAFENSVKDTIGLRNGHINYITEGNGKIWVGTNKGLHIIKNDTLSYVPLVDQGSNASEYAIVSILPTKEATWVGAYDGFFLLDNNNNAERASKRFGFKELDSLTPWGLTQHTNGDIWVAASNKIFRYSSSSKEMVKVPVEWHSHLKQLDFWFFDIKDFGDFFLVGSGKGLLKGIFDGKKLRLEPFFLENGAVAPLYFIYGSFVDKAKNIWLGTYQNRIKKVSLKNGFWEEETLRFKNEFDMHQHVRYINQDAQSNIWVSASSGLYQIWDDSKEYNSFISDCTDNPLFSTSTHDNKEGYWFGDKNQLYHVTDDVGLREACFKRNPLEVPHLYQPKRILHDRSNRLWIAADSGLHVTYLDSEKQPKKWYRYTYKDVLPHNWVRDILEVNDSTFWLGTYNDLVKLELKNGDLANPLTTRYSSDTDQGLSNNYIKTLALDKDSTLWAGTYAGLNKAVDLDKGTFEKYLHEFENLNSLSDEYIKQLLWDDHFLWIGTQTGLNLYNVTEDNFVRLGIEDGLPSTYILALEKDKEGFIWVGTDKGLLKTKWDSETKSLVNRTVYTKQNGMPSNAISRMGILKSHVSGVIVATAKGGLQIEGIAKSMDTVPFQLGWDEFKTSIKDKSGFFGKPFLIENKRLSLSHHQHSIQLSYASLDLTDVQFNTYRHKLEPIHSDWVETGTNSELTYYNLAPGDYKFVLDGTNHQGIWSQKPLELSFTLHPPFWKTNWAYGLYVLALGGLLFWGYRTRIRKERLMLEQQMALKQARLEEREQLRAENTADFHDELGAKLTKISMFLTLTERSWSQKEDPKEWLGKIRDNVKELSVSFRDLLWMTDPKKDNLGAAFTRLNDFGEELFKGNGTQFKAQGYYEVWESIPMDAQAKKQWLLIFKEAMNNSAKYAHAKAVIFSVIQNNGKIDAYLEDNGRGFNTELMSKGRGLKNMKDRATRIGAHFDIKSSNKGTKISLTGIPHMGEGKAIETL
ncbi:MAG: two-component regulator propeller domain-containing protein [Bacteroidota bacterium]